MADPSPRERAAHEQALALNLDDAETLERLADAKPTVPDSAKARVWDRLRRSLATRRPGA